MLGLHAIAGYLSTARPPSIHSQCPRCLGRNCSTHHYPRGVVKVDSVTCNESDPAYTYALNVDRRHLLILFKSLAQGRIYGALWHTPCAVTRECTRSHSCIVRRLFHVQGVPPHKKPARKYNASTCMDVLATALYITCKYKLIYQERQSPKLSVRLGWCYQSVGLHASRMGFPLGLGAAGPLSCQIAFLCECFEHG